MVIEEEKKSVPYSLNDQKKIESKNAFTGVQLLYARDVFRMLIFVLK